MSNAQKFGGPWTVEKLNILSDYLDFYTTALKNQPFQLVYIDAFAGSGRIEIGDQGEREVIDGSARLALKSAGHFAEYIFIEKSSSSVEKLNNMVSQEFPDKARLVKIMNEDCNTALLEICRKINWKKTRAVLFLDPYAADVKWETLRTIAATKAIDVWYLFPFNAVNRMMKKSGVTDPKLANKLNAIFGDSSWKTEFYRKDDQTNLFEEMAIVRYMSTDSLKEYIEERLRTIFPGVSSHSRLLLNSKNSPLFLFCFAVSNDNPKAIGLAFKVANYILKDQRPS